MKFCKLLPEGNMILRSPSRTGARVDDAPLINLNREYNRDNLNRQGSVQSIEGSTNCSDASTSNTQITSAEIAAASVKLPQFWTSCPEAWFIHSEMQFATRNIVTDRTKFEYVITALPQDVIMTVLDVIQNPSAGDQYGNLKRTLIERHTISENRRLDKILSDSEIGDRRPSEFYRSLLLLAGSNFSLDVLKKLWLRKLPKSVNVALTGSNLSDVDQLMRLADNIWEVLQRDEVAEVRESVAVPGISNLSGLGKVVESLVEATTKICESVRTLSLEVASIRNQTPYYSPHPRRFGRSRSRSRDKSANSNWLCRFHYRSGNSVKTDK